MNVEPLFGTGRNNSSSSNSLVVQKKCLNISVIIIYMNKGIITTTA